MTEQEKQEIISAVLSSIRTNSKTISQLTSVSEMLDDDCFELNGGRKVSYGVLFANHVSKDEANESWEYFDTHKVDKDSRGLVEVHQAPVVFLDAMGSLDGHTLSGRDGLEYRTDTKKIYDYPGGKLGAPNQGAVYISKNNLKKFVWNGTDMEELKADECPLFVDYMQPVSFADLPVGGSYYVPSSHKIAVKIDENSTKSYDPLTDALYFFREKGMIYTWDADASVWVPASSDTKPVNDLETGGEDKALSAEMGKRLKAKVDEVQANIERLYNNLGNIAFWDAAAKSSAAPVPIDWGNPKHTVTLALSMTNAVVKRNGEVVSNGDSIQVEEGGTLTLIVEPASGYALTSVQSSTTGATVTDLGNGTYSVAIVMGGSNVTLNVAASAEGHYLSPENGELVFWLDGLDVKATDASWADKISLGNSDEITLVPNGTIGQSTVMPDEENHCWKFADANIKTNGVFLTSNATRNYSPSLYTIEVVYKTTSFGGRTINRSKIISFARSAADDINPVIYYSARNAGSSGWIDGARIPSSSIENDCWALNNELNTPMVVGMNGDMAVSKGLILQTIGATHWSADSNITALGGTLDPNNGTTKTCMFAGNIYAVRVWSGKLTAAQMLHNQRVDNERYNLGLTLPESVQ